MFVVIASGLAAIILIGIVTYLLQGAPYVPSGEAEIEEIKQLLAGKKSLKILDVGSGDGRVVRQLAALGHDVTGVELNPLPHFRALRAQHTDVNAKRTHFVRGSFWNYDMSHYDVVIVYGIPHIMYRLEQKLQRELRPGARIISNNFFFPNLHLRESHGKVRVYGAESKS